MLLMGGVASTLGFYHVRLVDALGGEEVQRERAKSALLDANRYRYFNHIHLAWQAYWDIQLARANELIRECKDFVTERGWEWNYLDRITEAHVLQGQGHTQPVHALAFERHGRWMVSGSGDRSLLFWDPLTGKMLRKLAGHSGPVWGLALSPDGRRLASVAGSERDGGEVIVWDLTEGPYPQAREAFRIKDGGAQAAVAFHPNGLLFAVATEDPSNPGDRQCAASSDCCLPWP